MIKDDLPVLFKNVYVDPRSRARTIINLMHFSNLLYIGLAIPI